METAVFTKVWVARAAIGLALGVISTWTCSFLVADYVVKAHTTSAASADAALVSSLGLLNESIAANTASLNALRDKLEDMTRAVDAQGGQLVVMQSDVERIKTAVQGAGIDIKASAFLKDILRPTAKDWNAIAAQFQIPDGAPVFLQIEAPFEQ